MQRGALGAEGEVEVPAAVLGRGVERGLDLAEVEVDAARVERDAVAVGHDEAVGGAEPLQRAGLAARVRHLGRLPRARHVPDAAAEVVQRQRPDARLVEARRVAHHVQLPQPAQHRQPHVRVLVDALAQQYVALRPPARVRLAHLVLRPARVVPVRHEPRHRHAEEHAGAAERLRPVARHVVHLFRERAHVHGPLVVVLGQPVGERVERREERVVVADDEPLLPAAAALRVRIHLGHEREVAHRHDQARVRAAHVRVDAGLGQSPARFLQLRVRGVQEHQHELAAVRVPAAVREPVGPLIDRARPRVREPLVGGRDAEHEVGRVGCRGERRPRHGRDQGLGAFLGLVLLVDVHHPGGVDEELLRELRDRLPGDISPRDLHVSLRVLERLLELVPLLPLAEPLHVVVANHGDAGSVAVRRGGHRAAHLTAWMLLDRRAKPRSPAGQSVEAQRLLQRDCSTGGDGRLDDYRLDVCVRSEEESTDGEDEGCRD